MSSNLGETLLVPLVGAHFRPPAKQVLTVLPAGCRLGLVPDPDNAYDAKAIKVLVDVGAEVPAARHAALEETLQGTGVDISELIGDGLALPLHLGYIADSDGKQLGASRQPGNREAAGFMAAGGWRAELAFAADGKPQVRLVRLESEDEDEEDEWGEDACDAVADGEDEE